MKILVINCGSSSLKYQVIDMLSESLLAKGLVERIGIENSAITHEKIGEEKVKTEIDMPTHKEAIQQVFAALTDEKTGIVKSISEIGAVGHRVSHAGEKYASSVLIDDNVIEVLKDCIELAPLHNLANLEGISVCRDLMPDTPMVAVFDTAYHQTMPPEAYIYAIPYRFYEKYGVRRYFYFRTFHQQNVFSQFFVFLISALVYQIKFRFRLIHACIVITAVKCGVFVIVVHYPPEYCIYSLNNKTFVFSFYYFSAYAAYSYNLVTHLHGITHLG